MDFKKTFILVAISAALFLSGCGPEGVAPIAALDTPAHHVENGNTFLKTGKLADAMNEFSRAVALDPRYSPGYLGLGFVYSRQGAFAKGLENLKIAYYKAKSDQQEIASLIGLMRLYLMGGNKVSAKWLDQMIFNFNKAMTLSPNNPEAHFIMGEGYKKANRLKDAAAQYTKVLDINAGFVEAAKKALAKIQQTDATRPDSKVGKPSR